MLDSLTHTALPISSTSVSDVQKWRAMFPALHQLINGKPLVYFDNAATTHKPQSVIDSVNEFYSNDNSNVHRGVHTLSQRATAKFENVRELVRKFVNANEVGEIIFTKGTTDAINTVADSFGNEFIGKGDEIVLSGMEHHSNIVPWQLLAKRTGAIIKVIPVLDDGSLDIEAYSNLLSERTKIIGITHLSNALGTINPIKRMAEMAHSVGAKVLVDSAQSIAHIVVDVQELDIDFLCFSGHKIYAPTGIGVLYGRKELLNAMPPYQGGGDMILSVSFENTVYNALPYKFEAGTPNIAGAIGLGKAIEFVQEIGIDTIANYEHELLDYATKRIQELPKVRIIGTAQSKASVLSFVIDGIHPHDVGSLLDRDGIAIRAGHHCAQPVMKRFGIPASNRASFAFYNTVAEIDVFIESLKSVISMFAH
jgi:cysteine desulfurase / selenocysteine lyase